MYGEKNQLCGGGRLAMKEHRGNFWVGRNVLHLNQMGVFINKGIQLGKK